jgi:hypothetical protein
MEQQVTNKSKERNTMEKCFSLDVKSCIDFQENPREV